MLLTFTQQQAIKPFAANSENSFNQIITEVEAYELSQMLGRAFYQAVSATPEDYTELLDGDTYENCNGDEITTRGMRYVLAFLNYAKYATTDHIKATFSGQRVKTTPNSEQITQGDIKRIETHNRQIALYEFENIKAYLNTKHEDYPLWNYSSDKLIERPTVYSVRK